MPDSNDVQTIIEDGLEKLEQTVNDKFDKTVSKEEFDKLSESNAEKDKKIEELEEAQKDLSSRLETMKTEEVKVLTDYEDPQKALGLFMKHVQIATVSGDKHDTLVAHEKMKRQKLSQVEGVGSKGGWLVPTVVDAGVHGLAFQGNPLLQRLRRITTAKTDLWQKRIKKQTDLREGIAAGAVTYRIGELEAMTDSTIEWEMIEIPIFKMATLTTASDELLEDSAENITSELQTDMAVSESNKVMAEFINGTGVKQLEGLMTANSLVTQAKETGQAADTFEYLNALNMLNKLVPQFRANAVWVHSPEVAPQLPQMNLTIGTAGIPVYQPAGMASVAGFSTLFGMPVIESSFLPTLGDLGDIILVDPSQYWFIQGSSMSDTSSEVYWLTNRQAFKLVTRNGGKIWMPRSLPVRPADTLEQSAVVTLAARA
jgi:HK97 family phage major capsid protein